MAVAMFNFGTGAVVSDPVLEFFCDAVRTFATEFGGKDELRELAESAGVLTRESGRLRPDSEKWKGQSSGGRREPPQECSAFHRFGVQYCRAGGARSNVDEFREANVVVRTVRVTSEGLNQAVD